MPTIEYFYSAHSAFAYLGSSLLARIADATGADIIHKPMDLRVALTGSGESGFAGRTQKHMKYYFKREIDRWAEYRNAPVLGYRPTHHDNSNDMCNGMLLAGLQQGLDIGNLAHALLEGHWRYDANLDDRDTLVGLANGVGVDPEPLLAAALSDEVQTIYKANTQEAIDRSVFGSPTYFVDGDMFYGQDHLEMIERALKQPFKGDWPI
ncbi:MAG: 2-hydroxychromene-2-carboxylate isomerase [Alphaproteobacteria bacterium]|jgi:2-hydroxychromene-2-carboxylate isomerase|nr:2-hydroxychromene-2-carboxylate isomerase [Alphaproteobacteria bacterium]